MQKTQLDHGFEEHVQHFKIGTYLEYLHFYGAIPNEPIYVQIWDPDDRYLGDYEEIAQGSNHAVRIDLELDIAGRYRVDYEIGDPPWGSCSNCGFFSDQYKGNIQILSFDVTPVEVTAGDTVYYSFSIRNNGELNGTLDIIVFNDKRGEGQPYPGDERWYEISSIQLNIGQTFGDNGSFIVSEAHERPPGILRVGIHATLHPQATGYPEGWWATYQKERSDLRELIYIPPLIPCEEYQNQQECEAAGCYWYNNSCHTYPPECSNYLTQQECEAAGCYWYNGVCHVNPPPPPDIMKYILIGAGVLMFGIGGYIILKRQKR